MYSFYFKISDLICYMQFLCNYLLSLLAISVKIQINVNSYTIFSTAIKHIYHNKCSAENSSILCIQQNFVDQLFSHD